MKKNIQAQRARRKKRVSANIHGTLKRPRVSVYRSNKYTYAQAIDDDASVTLATVDSRMIKKIKATKSETAKLVGEKLAEKLIKMKIKTVLFDRGPYLYKGRVKSLAEGLRAGGILI